MGRPIDLDSDEHNEEPEVNLPQTYSVALECCNCRSSDEFEIPFGTTVEDYAKKQKKDAICGWCGCTFFKKQT